MCLRAGYTEHAVRLLQEILRADPERVDALIELGGAWMRLDRPEDAIKVLERVLGLEPDSVEAACRLGDVLVALGEHEGAYAAFGRVLSRKSDAVDALVGMASIDVARAQWLQAEKQLRHALQLRADHVGGCALLAEVMGRTGRADEAQALQQRTGRLRWAASIRVAGYALDLMRAGLKSKGEEKDTGVLADYVPRLDVPPPRHVPARVICFFLPQFHAIPENDAWWGNGFTEWSNVRPARPQFVGHYQPHMPDALGYYDLHDADVLCQQVELAKLYGIGGFCFYFYWFGGKRLLEKPITSYLQDRSLDLPFCLCWANENWSRRWDGRDSEILIAQSHSEADDFAFIEHVARYMRDARYIRISGRPLLLIYRPGLLPDARQTAQRWRRWCRDNGIGEIYLVYSQSFDRCNPADFGCDAAVEFPPNNTAPPRYAGPIKPLADDLQMNLFDWTELVRRSERYEDPGYMTFRGVCPSWDNTARRGSRGTAFLGSNPQGYQRWLRNAIEDTSRRVEDPQERLVFVNAWNEWAEGAHLEPDARYGYAWLQATRNALCDKDVWPDSRRRIVLVSHDAHPHGAQYLALNLARTLRQSLGFAVDLVCLGDGALKSEFARWTTVHDLAGKDPRGAEATQLARTLYAAGHRAALVNTTVSGHFLDTLSTQGLRCVALVHELGGVLEQYALHEQATVIARKAAAVVFPARQVAESFEAFAARPCTCAAIRPQGLYKRALRHTARQELRAQLRTQLGLPERAQIVLGIGYADRRKGVDLFVEAGLELAAARQDVYWVWVGHWDASMQRHVDTMLDAQPHWRERFVFPGIQRDTDVFYGGADLFVLSSREDPFPSVVLEALADGLPVVGFAGAGGCDDLLSRGCGVLVDTMQGAALARAVDELLVDAAQRQALGQRGAEIVARDFSFRHYVYDLLDLAGVGLRRVSVIVPNFNYGRYLEGRLKDIFEQSYPVFEVIFLDDCSSDDSVDIARRLLQASGIDHRILINAQNSGSVFRQWANGVSLARGTHVWIAEADDRSEAEFLDGVLHGFVSGGVVLSYCESKQIDEQGRTIALNYHAYVEDVDSAHWHSDYVAEGLREIDECLSIKNTIPNVSATLFDAATLRAVLQEHLEGIAALRVAGDWLTYVLVLEQGRIAFSSQALNRHRRHARGQTISSINKGQVAEIRRVQQFIADRRALPESMRARARDYVEKLSVEYRLGAGQSAARG